MAVHRHHFTSLWSWKRPFKCNKVVFSTQFRSKVNGQLFYVRIRNEQKEKVWFCHELGWIGQLHNRPFNWCCMHNFAHIILFIYCHNLICFCSRKWMQHSDFFFFFLPFSHKPRQFGHTGNLVPVLPRSQIESIFFSEHKIWNVAKFEAGEFTAGPENYQVFNVLGL